jgi:NADPH:quinone reductase-like Zn-dependent oxidoreductase
MKALQLNTFEGKSVLLQADIPQPVPADNQVLIRIHALGVTPSELQWYPTSHMKSGERRERPIPGHEFSGVAHAHRATVTATVSAQNAPFVLRLGASEAIDYRASPFEARSQEFDVVVDTVGGKTLEKSWAMLKDSGRMVTIATESEGTGDQRTKDAFFIVEPKSDQLFKIAQRLDKGSLMCFVNASVSFENGASAFEGHVKGRRGFGKVVISVLPD